MKFINSLETFLSHTDPLPLTTNSVNEILLTIRPFILADGGDIELVEIRENSVYIKLLGACNGCPLSTFTVTFLVEQELKKRIPEIKQVIQVF